MLQLSGATSSDMNFSYILIGAILVPVGVFFAKRSIEQFLKRLRDKKENRLMVWLDGIIFTPALLEMFVVFLGVLAILKGFGLF